MKAGIIVQARASSQRFPNKCFALLQGKPVIEHCLERLKTLSIPLVVAIPKTKQNDVLYNWLIDRGYEVFRGEEIDILDRFFKCATKFQFDTIIRVCADTPYIEPGDILDHVTKYHYENRFTYGDGSWLNYWLVFT